MAVVGLIEPIVPPAPAQSGGATLRVLIVLRPDATSRFGGDTVQVNNTAAALRQLGVEVDVVETIRPDPRGYDAAHIFGISEPEKCGPQIDACKSAGVPLVVTPIWISLKEFFARSAACERVLKGVRRAADAERGLARVANRSTESLIGWRTHIRNKRMEARLREFLRAADVLLPGTTSEAREYALHLGVMDRPFVVAPVGLSFEHVPAWSRQRAGVVCAGRVESRKNQAMTALALRDDHVDVTFVGEIYDYYGDLCKKWASARTRFLDQLPQPELFELFARAEVHCLPSWSETAGMASFEAAACGAKVVAGNRGCEIDYLGPDAEYADPGDPESIRAAVRRALKRPPRATGDRLDRRIHELTWRRAAEKTLEAYKIALGVPLP